MNDIYPVKDCCHTSVLAVHASLGAVRLVCSIVTKTRTARSTVANGNTSPLATWRTFILFYHKIIKQYGVKKKKKRNGWLKHEQTFSFYLWPSMCQVHHQPTRCVCFAMKQLGPLPGNPDLVQIRAPPGNQRLAVLWQSRSSEPELGRVDGGPVVWI